ncbi:glycosyltransferase family 2 protein [Ramlibacter sp. USB13]|uniref:Glycosyltransferase family 2 protein n=1 Tax=Ramlibacter cellulosilyticus TaxID=2764187 RepID=A0A923MNW4_9BURK|nr:glycosyltransferase family 2 protein [Ramlibacter cellulosilyticus]MBC5782795.1 glycosyltransferase family 2 protein [Ramlibacter cellulosilyticus]
MDDAAAGDRTSGGTPACAPLVVAVVVTFNPGPELHAHLLAIREQVAQAIVVDNGSSQAAAIREVCEATGCEFVGNAANRGLAAALNQGAELALARGATWLATFDQDSLVPAAAVQSLLDAAETHPAPASIAILAVSHADRGTGRAYHHPSDVLQEGARWRELRTTITSGSLVRCATLRQLGLFEERLFIDCIDHEFCLRSRRHGWRVVEVPAVLMPHSLGASRVHNILGRRTVATHHSPLRRYYMTRNQLEVFGRHLLFDPVLCARALATLAAVSVFVLLLEEQRLAKLGAMLQGLADFAARRFGPRA